MKGEEGVGWGVGGDRRREGGTTTCSSATGEHNGKGSNGTSTVEPKLSRDDAKSGSEC